MLSIITILFKTSNMIGNSVPSSSAQMAWIRFNWKICHIVCPQTRLKIICLQFYVFLFRTVKKSLLWKSRQQDFIFKLYWAGLIHAIYSICGFIYLFHTYFQCDSARNEMNFVASQKGFCFFPPVPQDLSHPPSSLNHHPSLSIFQS